MTRNEAAAKFAEAYKAYQVIKQSAVNIAVATEYATKDVLSMVRHMSEADAVAVILDEASIYQEAA